MGGKNWGLHLLLIGSFRLLLRGHWALLPDWGLHSGVGGHQRPTEGYPAPGRGGRLTPLIRGGGVKAKASESVLVGAAAP